jgi:streptomycin 6-kinase
VDSPLPFGFEPDEELAGGYCSRVWATGDLVLKVPWRGEELDSGWQAALALQGRGGPPVHHHDPTTGALVMDRIVPGTPLHQSGLSEEGMDEIFAGFVSQWSGLPLEGMTPLATYTAETPHRALRDELLANSPPPVFLHGDLHHENILAGPGGSHWVIDPKGLSGDPAFEAAAWLRNPRDQSRESGEIEARLERRTQFLQARFGWDRWRMEAWTLLTLDDTADPPDRDTFWDDLTQLLRRRLLGA